MPDWIINAVTILMIVSFLLACWTVGHAWGNWLVARELEERILRYARNMLFREFAVLTAQGSLLTVALLTFLTPRPVWVRITISILLVVTALAVSGISWHDYLDMRYQLEHLGGVSEHRHLGIVPDTDTKED